MQRYWDRDVEFLLGRHKFLNTFWFFLYTTFDHVPSPRASICHARDDGQSHKRSGDGELKMAWVET